ncbi:MAG: HAMP domain-containing histidine kinase [Oscillospiraceae bacterium]|nr:HAMP domain-containing histidine kinase [Oscillospiraceae bacterium]
MLKKLRTKFVCIMMAFVTVMLLVIFGLVIFFMNAGLEAQSHRMMQSIESGITGPGTLQDRPETVSLPYFAIQLNRWGGIIATSGFLEMKDEETIQNMLQYVLNTEEQTGILEEYAVRFSKITRPTGQILIFADISSQRTIMRNLIYSCLLIGTASFLIFLGLSLLLSRWAIKPVEQAWQQQKQFVADASHELKTPLTVIMTNAELLQSNGCTEEANRQFSESILTMSRQMRGLVEGLLELARVDNGAVKTNYVPLDLSRLVTDAVLPFEPLFFEKEMTLLTAVEPGLRVKGSESHLRQVQDILLDNAMKYSEPGGEILLKLKRNSVNGVLSVSGPGEPISKEDLKNIFKRFYRIDKARSRDGSYGLGLSIAQSIVEEHNGRIWAESENGRNTFYVQLPLSD